MGVLRVLLAIGVLFHHVGTPYIMNGGLAVELFFVISGFYMALVLEGKYAQGISLFYSNRLLRLTPTYYLAFVAQLVLILFFDLGESTTKEALSDATSSTNAGSLALLSTNITLIGQELLSFFTFNDASSMFSWDPDQRDGVPGWKFLLIPQAWSISLELMFYLIAPFLAKRFRLIVFLFFLSLAIHTFIVFSDLAYNAWARRFFPGTLHFFLLGMISFRISKQFKGRLKNQSPAFQGLGILVLLVMLFLTREASPKNREFFYPIVTLYLSALVPFLFYSAKSNVDRKLGELSYSIYMFHGLTIGIGLKLLSIEGRILSLFALITTMVLSTAMYYWIDRPLDDWRQRRVTNRSVI